MELICRLLALPTVRYTREPMLPPGLREKRSTAPASLPEEQNRQTFEV